MIDFETEKYRYAGLIEPGLKREAAEDPGYKAKSLNQRSSRESAKVPITVEVLPKMWDKTIGYQ